jgi:phosphoribosyl 1,2-cyclic phosphate phosphodiesterase
MRIRMTLLGTGTSVGVPMLGCDCPGCTSDDPRDNRWRASALLQWEGCTVVIDLTPEFRLQMLRAGVTSLDAVLLTHCHADHIHGLDDVRPYGFLRKDPIPFYADGHTSEHIRTHFPYIWSPRAQGGGIPRIELRPVAEPFPVGGVEIVPVPVLHGEMPILGFRVGDMAYLTDCSAIPETSLPLLEGVRTLFLDAVRYKPHPTHFHLDAAIDAARRVGAERTFFTHLNHDFVHAALERECPPGMAPAYDGMVVDVRA